MEGEREFILCRPCVHLQQADGYSKHVSKIRLTKTALGVSLDFMKSENTTYLTHVFFPVEVWEEMVSLWKEKNDE